MLGFRNERKTTYTIAGQWTNYKHRPGFVNGLGLWITFTNERPQRQKSQSWLHCGTGVSRKSCPPYSMTFRLMSPYLETKERLSLFYLDKCNKRHFAKLAKLEVKSRSISIDHNNTNCRNNFFRYHLLNNTSM